MKRILALGLCLALLCPAARAAEEAKGWSRSEPGAVRGSGPPPDRQ